MKRKLSIMAVVLLFLIGVSIMSYPYIASVINNINMRESSNYYNDVVKKIEKKDYSEYFSKAKKYNKSLTSTAIITDPFDEKAYKAIGADYEETLNVDGNGLIGFIEIPKIDVNLPIYHGTDKEILSKGAGHLMNTSMPIGGKSTHAVISAHSAYPGQTFFDYLTDMEIGDYFLVKVLDKTLQYEVDQIKVIKPENTEDLRIVSGEDHVTLLTCTPYGINTHRLLVRGKRVPYVPEKASGGSSYTTERETGYYFFMGLKIPYWAAIAAIGVFVAIVILVVMIIIRKNKRKTMLSSQNAENKPAHSDDKGAKKGD